MRAVQDPAFLRDRTAASGLATALIVNVIAGASTTQRLTPVAVLEGASVTQIDVGGGHTCIRVSTGIARCFGSASGGQLGNPTETVSSWVPIDVEHTPALTPVSMPALTPASGKAGLWLLERREERCFIGGRQG